MAIGALRGTLVGNGNSVTNPSDLTGSVVVASGDLVFGVFGQQTNLTATTTITDNLGNSYSYQNTGTDPGSPTARPFWGRITVAGTLTTIHIPATASTNDWAGAAEVIEGPVIVSPLDANPANITSDVTSPFTCPATGTLGQPFEIVCAWGCANQSTTWAASSPNLLGTNVNNSTNVKVAVGYQLVTSTTTLSPAFTAAANPTTCILGTASFKCLVDVTDGAVSAQSATASGSGSSSSSTTDGAISASSASAAGASTSTSLTTDGAISASSASVSGTATSEWVANGSPDVQSATVSGSGLVETTGVSGSGDLVVSSAIVFGSALSSSAGSGMLVASSADAEGAGASAVLALGVLFVSAASSSGVSKSESIAFGALVAGSASAHGSEGPSPWGERRLASMLIGLGVRFS